MARKTPPRSTRANLAEYRKKRDFSRTSEPAGADVVRQKPGLEFVLQKHAASHLHYDLRLEMGGVMKSWAVPKGLSVDPGVKRLAMEVEHHPMEYNTFEGTIPKGEYGGGTVMLWDRGTYQAGDALPAVDNPEEVLLEELERGRLHLVFEGERIRGAYTLFRTSRGEGSRKPQWLLVKHDDAHAGGEEPTEVFTTSVVTGRSMEEIAAGKGGRKVWRSNRASPQLAAPPPARPVATSTLLPMKATAAKEVPGGRGWTFEPKYDGIRVLAFVAKGAVTLITRNGNDKARSFPEVTEAIRELETQVGEPLVLDGELVALQDGEPVRFESLQGRMHVADPRRASALAAEQPAALVAFDLLLAGDEVLLGEPWRERRKRLERVLRRREGTTLRLGETSGNAEEMLARARAGGWEGVVAKRTDSRYQPDRRSPDWLKLKLVNRQEMVVGGWTEPKGSRTGFGSLLLGYYTPGGELVYGGHVGTGFTQAMLTDIHRRLRAMERKTSPFATAPKPNEKPHWVSPKLVVEVEFNEWTAQGKLRQASFVGIRDDKDPKEVVREPASLAGRAPSPVGKGDAKGRRASKEAPGRGTTRPAVVQLDELRSEGGGTLELPDGELALTNLKKVFFPRNSRSRALTKGDLLRYYAEMAPQVLPAMQDRPLVLKRFPNGIQGEAFYQQTAPQDVPEGVRVEVLVNDKGEEQLRFVGGSLPTLLYTVQLGAISYDPWHSRLGALEYADYTILDLDPGEGASFRRVIEVARLVQEELDGFGLHGALKTSGASGLHIYLPLPPRTPLEAARLIAEVIATRVASRAPRVATVERTVRKRRRGTVYVDYLQNIQTKTVAGVYAARARPGATVSTPLAWSELEDDLDPRDFTILTVPERVRARGDLWAQGMAKPISFDTLLRAKEAAA